MEAGLLRGSDARVQSQGRIKPAKRVPFATSLARRLHSTHAPRTSHWHITCKILLVRLAVAQQLIFECLMFACKAAGVTPQSLARTNARWPRVGVEIEAMNIRVVKRAIDGDIRGSAANYAILQSRLGSQRHHGQLMSLEYTVAAYTSGCCHREAMPLKHTVPM